MKMANPPHPGELIREDILPALSLTVTDAARALGVSRKTLSLLINGHQAISAEMALRLEKVFGSSAEHWLRMQDLHDLALARKRVNLAGIRRLRAA